ncbi:MAG: hypothetical protein ACREN6_00015 [Gemmatimonadaceae bacterium]
MSQKRTTGDRGPKTEDRRPKTEDRRPLQTEDRRPRALDRTAGHLRSSVFGL